MDTHNLINNFKQKNYIVNFFETSKDAVSYLKSNINNKTIGFGDSDTIKTIKLYDVLSKNNQVYDPQRSISNEDFINIATKCLTTEIFFTSVNAFSFSGELVNIDGTGNRTAGSLFGHNKVYFIIGINKGELTLEKAIWRAKNVAAPKNAKRLNLKTPCALNGQKCFDCSSKDRICNALTIYYRAMNDTESEIIFINESLGF